MVSIRKRISKKRTRRQRRGKKQRGGQNNQQNMIERLAQNELLQRKSQRGGAGTDNLSMEDVETIYHGNVYFIKKKDGTLLDSLHLEEPLTKKEDVVNKYKEVMADENEKKNHIKAWSVLGEEEGKETEAEVVDDQGATGPPPADEEEEGKGEEQGKGEQGEGKGEQGEGND